MIGLLSRIETLAEVASPDPDGNSDPTFQFQLGDYFIASLRKLREDMARKQPVL